jgi:hypothetical protein
LSELLAFGFSEFGFPINRNLVALAVSVVYRSERSAERMPLDPSAQVGGEGSDLGLGSASDSPWTREMWADQKDQRVRARSANTPGPSDVNPTPLRSALFLSERHTPSCLFRSPELLP